MSDIPASTFLSNVLEIAGESPSYKLGHDGSDDQCDCIGLIIGAIRRSGGKWTGIHGSNYSARYEMASLTSISSAGDLSVGDVVYKVRAPGESGYSLPSRYSSSADRLDYYHVGVVTSVSPLVITHCTGPGIVRDSKLGKWSRHGRLKKIDYESEVKTEMEITAKVTAQSGSTVRLRKTAGGTVLKKVPVGDTVSVIERGETWSYVSYGSIKGYMQSEFLVFDTTTGTEHDDRLGALEKRVDALEALVQSIAGGVG